MESIKLLVGGREAFDCIISNINKANKHIKVNMFIWRDDVIGNDMAKALIEAADRGVKVHISKDKLGMLFEYSEELKHSFFHHNLYTRWYIQALILDKMYPMEGKFKSVAKELNPNLATMIKHKNITIDSSRTKRDHSKYYIFDGEVLILGGINIEDKEVTTDVSGMKYHDYMLELKGRDIVTFFKARLYGRKSYNSDATLEFIFNRYICGDKDFNVKEKLIKLLNAANKSVDIVMAYIGDKDINDCILNLIDKNVKVNLYLPQRANLQQDLNMKNLKELMIKTNNRINVYLSDRMIHAKLLCIDNRIITLGSTNLNGQAMNHLLELNLVLNKDTSVAENVEVFKSFNESINDLRSHSKMIYHYKEVKYNAYKAFLEGLV